MASCSFTHGSRTFTLTVTEKSYSIANNTSDVTWTLKISGGGSVSYDTYAKCTVNGEVVYNKKVNWSVQAFPAKDGSVSGTISGITHDSNTGAKSISFKLEGYNGDVSYSVQTASGNLTLTTIPRISEPTLSATGVSLGSNLNVYWTPKSTAFHYKIKFACGSWQWSTAWISPGSVSQQTYSYTVPHLIANYLSGATSGTMTVTLTTATKSGSNYSTVGTSSKTCTAKIPATAITSITTPVTLDDTNAEVVKFTPTATSLKYEITYTWSEFTYWPYGSDYIEPASTSEYTSAKTVPIRWAPYLTDKMSDTFSVNLITYTSTGKEVGRTSKSGTMVIPEYWPSFNYELVEGTASGFGVFVQGLSTVKSIYSDISTSYNASFTTETMEVEGVLYSKPVNPQDNVSGLLKNYGTNQKVVLKLYDSRGRYATRNAYIDVYQYFAPTVKVKTAVSGTTVTLTVTGKVAPVNNLNTKTITIVRRNTKTAQEVTVVDGATLSDYDYTYTLTETVADVDVVSYEYIVTVSDTINSTTLSKSTGVICISRLAGGLGVRLFAEAEEEGFWIKNIQYSMSDAFFLWCATNIAKEYSTTRQYLIHEYCIHNGTTYRAIRGTSGTWTAADWEEV